jgi:hypothetical protein
MIATNQDQFTLGSNVFLNAPYGERYLLIYSSMAGYFNYLANLKLAS